MSIILHIETATKNCSVALSHSGKLLALKENYSENYSHSEQLHGFIQKVLKKAAGSALLKDLKLVRSILESVVNSVGVPVTLKIRTGWCPATKNGELAI